MPLLTMRQDFRAPAFGAASTARHLPAPRSSRCSGPMRNGFDFLVLSEHHGIDDGWMPAPLTIAACILAMTDRSPVLLSALDPSAARPDPHRRADRGDRQRVPGTAVDRASARATASTSSRWPASTTRVAARSSRSRSRRCCRRGPANRSSGKAAQCASRPRLRPQPHPTVLVGGGVPAAARARRAPAAPDVADEHRPRAARRRTGKRRNASGSRAGS